MEEIPGQRDAEATMKLAMPYLRQRGQRERKDVRAEQRRDPVKLKFGEHPRCRKKIQPEPDRDKDLKGSLAVEPQPPPGRVEGQLAGESIGVGNDASYRVKKRPVEETRQRLAGNPLVLVLEKKHGQPCVDGAAGEVLEVKSQVR